MRGLITVKLANEQVNYGAKFLYKKCHFSERGSSSRAESLKQVGGEDGVEQRKDRGQIAPSPFLFQEKSPVSATLSSEAPHLRLRGNACVDELFFFQRKLFSSSFSSDSRDCISPLLHSSFLPSFPLIGFHLYTSVEPLGHPRFFSSFSVLQRACMKNKFLSHRLKFARTFARVEMKLSFLADMGCSGSQVLVFLCRTPLKAPLWPVFGFFRSRGSAG